MLNQDSNRIEVALAKRLESLEKLGIRPLRLKDAILRALQMAEHAGIRAILVHAKDQLTIAQALGVPARAMLGETDAKAA